MSYKYMGKFEDFCKIFGILQLPGSKDYQQAYNNIRTAATAASEAA